MGKDWITKAEEAASEMLLEIRGGKPMNEQNKKLEAEIKRVVAWQFDQVTNLTPEAHNDSLEIIAEQILQACKEAGLKFVGEPRAVEGRATLWPKIEEIEL